MHQGNSNLPCFHPSSKTLAFTGRDRGGFKCRVSVNQSDSSENPRLKQIRTLQISVSRIERRKSVKAIQDFVPMRITTRPPPPSITTMKSTKVAKEIASAISRKLPVVIENVAIKVKVKKDRHGIILLKHD